MRRIKNQSLSISFYKYLYIYLVKIEFDFIMPTTLEKTRSIVFNSFNEVVFFYTFHILSFHWTLLYIFFKGDFTSTHISGWEKRNLFRLSLPVRPTCRLCSLQSICRVHVYVYILYTNTQGDFILFLSLFQLYTQP